MAGSEIPILLAEDNEGDSLLTSELIEEHTSNCPLTVVRDGAAAVDFLFKRGDFRNAFVPDFILLDINMPKKNGLEVLAILKKDPNLKNIPTAILTTSSSYNDRMAAKQHYADYYFTKPLEEENLKEILSMLR